MGRPRRVSDDEILVKAREAFVEHGPALSTVAIAQQVGLTQAVLFQRFGTKNELMRRALSPPEVAPFVPLLEAGPTEEDIHTQLVRLANAIGNHFDVYFPCWSMLRATGLDVMEGILMPEVPPPVRSQRALAAWFRAAIATHRFRLLDPEATAILFLGAMQARSMMKHLFGDRVIGIDQERFVDNLVDVVLGDAQTTPLPETIHP